MVKIQFKGVVITAAVLAKTGDNAGRVSYVDALDTSDGSTYNFVAEAHPFAQFVGQNVDFQANVSGRVFLRPVQGKTGLFNDKSQKLTLSQVVVAPAVPVAPK